MRIFQLILVSLLVFSAHAAHAWNEKGHMIVARLAWSKLSAEARQSAFSILKTHPHYDEYLAAQRPDTIPADEWAFMRASYWPDWVRSNHSEEYNRPTWHYVSVAYVPARSKFRAADFPCQKPNIVTQIPACIEAIRDGDANQSAVQLCWLIHLVGDIHQPLHCASLWTEDVPEGDRGGNLSWIRIEGGMPARLHFTWDAMLGENALPAAIQDAVADLGRVEQAEAAKIETELTSHPTSADWASEGLALATEHVYLNGDLRPAHAEACPAVDLVPILSTVYLQNARSVARLRAVKAGRRLAASVSAAVNCATTSSSQRGD